MIAAILLAAGQSKRMGRNKLLMRFEMSSVIETIVARLIDAGLDDTLIVTGHEHERVEHALHARPVRFVFNPDYARYEMLRSIQIGLQAMREDCQAALLVLGDQPAIRVDTIQRVLAAHQRNTIVIPSYRRRRGHPILLDRVRWPAVLDLPPGSTLRTLIDAHTDRIRYVDIDNDSILRDLDTPEDYTRLQSDN